MADPNQAFSRLRQIEEYWRQNPGSAPGGTGATGLLSNDAMGWSRLMNQQNEHQNLLNELEGKDPLDIRRGGDFGGLAPSIAEDPNSTFNTSGGPFGRFGTGTGRQSASLLGLRKAVKGRI